MAIAFDASSAPSAGTGTLSWTHTPTGTPRGVLVLVIQNGTAADQVNAPTYGGTSMTEVALSPLLATANAGMPGAVHGFFLGASVPTGAQTVAVTVSGANSKRAVAVTFTAAADTEVDDTSTVDAASLSQPNQRVTVQTTASTDTVLVGAALINTGSPLSSAPGTGMTELLDHDFGNQTGLWLRRTDNGTGGDIDLIWESNSNTAFAMFGVAVREAVAAATLDIDDAAHSHSADSATLTQAHQLVVGAATQAQVADNLTLTQTHALTVQPATQAQTADSPTLTQTHILIVGSADQAHTADSPTLTLSTTLDTDDATQAHSAGQPALTQQHVLVVDSVTHTQTAGSLDLTQVHVLVVASASHTQTATTPAFESGVAGYPHSHAEAGYSDIHQESGYHSTHLEAV